ncbi:MAG: hypothetical protein OEZ36_05565 [Spirochaetota bacterium]|nr:hypothetical protein [Spirochaetota bacterium]
MSPLDDSVKAKVLQSLLKKRSEHQDDDEFFGSLDKIERVVLTEIHFGLYKVSPRDKKLLDLK